MLHLLFIIPFVYLTIASLIFVMMSIGAILTPDQKLGVKGGIEFAALHGIGWGILVLVFAGNLLDDLKAKLRGKE